jgi:hypothetical protein
VLHILPVTSYKRKMAHIIGRSASKVSLQIVILDRLRVLSRDIPVFFARSWQQAIIRVLETDLLHLSHARLTLVRSVSGFLLFDGGGTFSVEFPSAAGEVVAEFFLFAPKVGVHVGVAGASVTTAEAPFVSIFVACSQILRG